MMIDAGDWPVATMTTAVAASMPASRKNCHGSKSGVVWRRSGCGAFDPRGWREPALSSDPPPVEGSVEVAELIVQSRCRARLHRRRPCRRPPLSAGTGATSEPQRRPRAADPARRWRTARAHARRLNPRSIGAASTCWPPYSVTNDASTSSYVLAFAHVADDLARTARRSARSWAASDSCPSADGSRTAHDAVLRAGAGARCARSAATVFLRRTPTRRQQQREQQHRRRHGAGRHAWPSRTRTPSRAGARSPSRSPAHRIPARPS